MSTKEELANLLSNMQLNDLVAKVKIFMSNPENQKSFQEWYLKKYGKDDNEILRN